MVVMVIPAVFGFCSDTAQNLQIFNWCQLMHSYIHVYAAAMTSREKHGERVKVSQTKILKNFYQVI